MSTKMAETSPLLFYIILILSYLLTINISTANALNKTQVKTSTKTPTCFGNGMPFSLSYRTNKYNISRSITLPVLKFSKY